MKKIIKYFKGFFIYLSYIFARCESGDLSVSKISINKIFYFFSFFF